MKPNKVSMSCDSNPFYLDFWEPVSRVWKHHLGIEPYLFYVGEPEFAPKNGHGPVMIIPPVSGVPIHTQAQWARFYFTKMDPESTWITSDIDMFPLHPKHFVNPVADLPDDCWVALNSNFGHWFSVCYNVAKGKTIIEVVDFMSTFSEDVLRVHNNAVSKGSYNHTPKGLSTVFNHWGADEHFISGALGRFKAKNPERLIHCVRPGGQSSRRIDRDGWRYDEEKAKSGFYIDCHSLRPYSVHKAEIEKLLKTVFE